MEGECIPDLQVGHFGILELGVQEQGSHMVTMHPFLLHLI